MMTVVVGAGINPMLFSLFTTMDGTSTVSYNLDDFPFFRMTKSLPCWPPKEKTRLERCKITDCDGNFLVLEGLPKYRKASERMLCPPCLLHG